mmetsp:Transcript_33002/g.95556  ORF Transcript_33002/g.95556 Transcript_33002/m.95556 type:complete len:441 (-) Transcript_33002:34-1356(-)
MAPFWSAAAALALVGARFTGADEMGMPSDMDYGDFGGGYGGFGDDYGYGGEGYGGYGGYGEDFGGYGGDTGPAFTTIEDIAGVQKFLDEEATEPAVVGFFNDETNQDDISVFEEIAGSNRYNYRFAYSVEDDVRDHFKGGSGCSVYVYLPPRFVNDKYDKPKARYPSKHLDSSALTKFIEKKTLPLVGQKTWRSNERYDKTGLPVVTLFTKVDLEKNPKGFDYYSNRLRRVAQDYVGKLVFNVGDKEDFSYLLEDYGLELPDKKHVGVGIQEGNNYYKMTEPFNVDNLRAFVADYAAGKLTPKVKEEPDYGAGAEEDDDEETAVVTVTDSNFAEVVNDDSKDVMVEFYAPWCGHCQALKPEYKRLAADFESDESVTIAAMDATANEIPPNFDVQGYPTIMFLPAKSKNSPISYDGPRDTESMKTFIKEHATAAGSAGGEL